MSPSMNQCVPFQTSTTSVSAVWQPVACQNYVQARDLAFHWLRRFVGIR
jgi:hypothetical protein